MFSRFFHSKTKRKMLRFHVFLNELLGEYNSSLKCGYKSFIHAIANKQKFRAGSCRKFKPFCSTLRRGREDQKRKWDRFMAIPSIRLNPIHIICDYIYVISVKSNMVPVSRQRVEWVGFYCISVLTNEAGCLGEMVCVWLVPGDIWHDICLTLILWDFLTHRRCCNKTWGCPLSGPCSGPPGDQLC